MTAPLFISEPVAGIVSTVPSGYGALRSALAHQFPCIAVVEQSCRNEFRAVDDRTAAHGQQEIDFALLAQCDRLAQRLDRRVGFDAPELDRVAAREGGAHLVVDAVAPDRAPPPKVTITRLPAGINSPSRAIVPLPKTSFVGF